MKSCLKKFPIFQGKHHIPRNTAKFLRTPILKNICERLLLYLTQILNVLACWKMLNKRNYRTVKYPSNIAK